MNDCVKYWPGWEKVDPVFYWKKHNLTVVGDAHDCQGNRFHLVKEAGYTGQTIANASVWSVGNDCQAYFDYCNVP